jgi:hypothetical protein
LKTTLNRPYGTYTSIAIYPGLASWAKVNRAYGAARQLRRSVSDAGMSSAHHRRFATLSGSG